MKEMFDQNSQYNFRSNNPEVWHICFTDDPQTVRAQKIYLIDFYSQT